MAKLKFKTEKELLLNCAKSVVTPQSQPEISSLAGKSDINWQKLFRIAQDHGVVPLVYRSLKNALVDLPPELNQQLTVYLENRTRQSFLLTRELIRVVQLLEKEGISAVPFKGACLAVLAYGNLTYREFSDLDILLHRADVPQAIKILHQDRYRDRHQSTPSQAAECWERHHEWDLIKDNGLVALDLHWGFTERVIYFPLDLAALKHRLMPLDLVGRQVLTFSLADTILILCINGSKEFWHRLPRICDLAALIARQPQIDWAELVKTATETGSLRMLLVGLILAREVMETSLPAIVIDAIAQDPQAQLLAQEIKSDLLERIYHPLKDKEMVKYHLKIRERWRDRLWYIYHTFKYSGGLTPSTRDRETIALPPKLNFLYYFVRPFRLLRKYGIAIVKKRSPS